ncbi:MAG: hypothetical protein HY703_13955 [Gemmatimonadetes bacterium]|nr:hypothetical protein [Gemmatimonadota bacterium]
MGSSKRRAVWLSGTLLTEIEAAAVRETLRRGRPVSVGAYTRGLLARTLRSEPEATVQPEPVAPPAEPAEARPLTLAELRARLRTHPA